MDKPEIKHSKYWYDYNRNDPDRENPFTDAFDYMMAEAVVGGDEHNRRGGRGRSGCRAWDVWRGAGHDLSGSGLALSAAAARVMVNACRWPQVQWH